jgi:Arc/MetJ-type ribon-helix-helix transcriptional regulator
MKKKSARAGRRPPAADGAFSRRTITIPPDLKAAIDALVGRGQFSAFAQQAFAHELQRESIARWLGERETARRGKPLPTEAVQFAELAWRNRR